MIRAGSRRSSRELLRLPSVSCGRQQKARVIFRQPHARPPAQYFHSRPFLHQAAEASQFASGSHTGNHDFTDIAIVGGSVVGLSFAASLVANKSFRSSNAHLSLIEGSSLDRAREWSKVKQDGSEGPISDWENRVIYLTEDNRQWLDNIGVTPYLMSSRLGAVHRMHVTDGVTNAALDFDTPDSNQHRMGTMVEISNLQQALLQSVQKSQNFREGRAAIIDGSKVEGIIADEDAGAAFDAWPILKFTDSTRQLKARLLVGADGANSPVRKYAGIKATGWEYGRMGLVATMKFKQDPFDERTAYQRFLPTGTIAWLPLSRDTASLVWTLPPDMAKAISTIHKSSIKDGIDSESPLAHLITAAFRLPWPALAKVLKKITTSDVEARPAWIVEAVEEELRYAKSVPDQVPAPVEDIEKTSVAAFPLKLAHAECYLGSSRLQTSFAESGIGALQPSALLNRVVTAASSSSNTDDEIRGRTALIGDAAHTIHPLAGQGLNLGLADARSLSKTLIHALERGEDIGSHISLSPYPRDRYLVNQAMLSAVDHLHWLFVKTPPGHPDNSLIGNAWSKALVWGRSTGFEVLNEISSVKRLLTGFAGSRK